MNVGRPLAVALLCATLFGGCGDDPEPKFDPPSTSSPPSSTTASPQHASATDFARGWVELQNAMQLTGQTAAYKQASKPCAGCIDFAEQVNEIYNRGGWIRTHGWKILSLHTQGHGRHVAVIMRIESSPTKYRNSSDGPVKTLAGGRERHRLELKHTSQGWLVADSAVYAS